MVLDTERDTVAARVLLKKFVVSLNLNKMDCMFISEDLK